MDEYFVWSNSYEQITSVWADTAEEAVRRYLSGRAVRLGGSVRAVRAQSTIEFLVEIEEAT